MERERSRVWRKSMWCRELSNSAFTFEPETLVHPRRIEKLSELAQEECEILQVAIEGKVGWQGRRGGITFSAKRQSEGRLHLTLAGYSLAQRHHDLV